MVCDYALVVSGSAGVLHDLNPLLLVSGSCEALYTTTLSGRVLKRVETGCIENYCTLHSCFGTGCAPRLNACITTKRLLTRFGDGQCHPDAPCKRFLEISWRSRHMKRHMMFFKNILIQIV